MYKLAKFAITAAVLVLPFAASAATISNPIFSNGDTTIDATGNSTVSGTFTLQVGSGEVCEILRTQSDPSQPFTDTSVGGSLGYQWGTVTNVPFTVKVPPNTSTVYPTVQCAGIWGGSRSVDGNDSVVAGPVGLGTIRVTTNGSSGGSTGGTIGGSSQLDQLIALLTAMLTKPTTPAKPAGCDGVVAYNGMNAYAAQQSLFNVSAGAAVFNANGVYAPTGYFGSISAKASAAVAVACK